jgi:tetratricopeptide (TPR) repeat protein
MELDPTNADAWGNKGAALLTLSRYQEALPYFNKSLELNPESAYMWDNRAQTYAFLGEKENALKDLAQAIKLDPKYKERAKKTEAYKSLMEDEDFKKLVE